MGIEQLFRKLTFKKSPTASRIMGPMRPIHEGWGTVVVKVPSEYCTYLFLDHPFWESPRGRYGSGTKPPLTMSVIDGV